MHASAINFVPVAVDPLEIGRVPGRARSRPRGTPSRCRSWPRPASRGRAGRRTRLKPQPCDPPQVARPADTARGRRDRAPSSSSQRCDPMNPLAPVTSVFIHNFGRDLPFEVVAAAQRRLLAAALRRPSARRSSRASGRTARSRCGRPRARCARRALPELSWTWLWNTRRRCLRKNASSTLRLAGGMTFWCPRSKQSPRLPPSSLPSIGRVGS